MSMTKNDYELIAGVLREVKHFATIPTAHKKYNDGKYDTYYMVLNKLSGELAQNNPDFKRDRFLKECGVTK